MEGKFRISNGERIRKQQTFDPKKIFVEKCGQKINVYDSIQEASVDTDLYKTLEKYGSIEPLMNPNLQQIEQDFEEYETLMTLHEKIEKAENMWLKLDAGVKEKFHNNKNEFVEKGKQWLQEMLAKEQKIEAVPVGTPIEKIKIKEEK